MEAPSCVPPAPSCRPPWGKDRPSTGEVLARLSQVWRPRAAGAAGRCAASGPAGSVLTDSVPTGQPRGGGSQRAELSCLHPLPGRTAVCPGPGPCSELRRCPGKARLLGSSCRALSSLGAGQSFKGPHTKGLAPQITVPQWREGRPPPPGLVPLEHLSAIPGVRTAPPLGRRLSRK